MKRKYMARAARTAQVLDTVIEMTQANVARGHTDFAHTYFSAKQIADKAGLAVSGHFRSILDDLVDDGDLHMEGYHHIGCVSIKLLYCLAPFAHNEQWTEGRIF